jgi:hypothetical protein
MSAPPAPEPDAGLVVPLALRLRAYALAVGLTFLSVPLLHLYLAVPLAPAELLVHAADISLGSALGLAVFELALDGWQRRLEWRLRRSTGVLLLVALPLTMALLWTGTGPFDWLPGTAAIRHKHVASGYGDMSTRVLPLVLLIFYLAFQATRRAALQSQLHELRRLNQALLARETEGGGAPVEVHAGIHLRHDGGELHVRPEAVVRVQARENYCEFVLGEGVSTRRPLVRMTIADAAAKLPKSLFARTHRSHLVNLGWAREWLRDGRSASLRLANGDEVPVARSRADAVRAALRRFAQSA